MAKVTMTPPRVDYFELVKQITREDNPIIKRQVQENVRRIVQDISHRHYSNLLKEINYKLSPRGMVGGPSIHGGGVPNLSYTQADGKRRSIILPTYWSKLDDKYRERKPKSRVFWHKKGKLFRDWRASGPAKHANLKGLTKVVSLKSAKRSHKRGLMNLKFRIELSDLPWPFNKMIRKPYSDAKYNRSLTGLPGIENTDVRRIVFPEKTRGFIRAISAALGKDFRTKLRKI